MCLALYIFTGSTLPEVNWDPENPGVYIEKVIPGEDQGVLQWNNENKNVYYIGSRQGCGCGWQASSESDDPTEIEGKQTDRKRLKEILGTIDLQDTWMIICWEGDQGGAILNEESLSFTDIENIDYEFEELRKYTFG